MITRRRYTATELWSLLGVAVLASTLVWLALAASALDRAKIACELRDVDTSFTIRKPNDEH